MLSNESWDFLAGYSIVKSDFYFSILTAEDKSLILLLLSKVY
jgi:hypothetical protein